MPSEPQSDKIYEGKLEYKDQCLVITCAWKMAGLTNRQLRVIAELSDPNSYRVGRL